MDVEEFPYLYNIDKTGKCRVWYITVHDNIVTSFSGIKDGKLIESSREYQGKNIGKKNETSPEEQAILEANKDWVKKVEKGYAPENLDHPKYLALDKERKETGGKNLNAVSKMTGSKSKNVKERVDSFLIPGIVGPKPMKTTELKTENSKKIKSSVLKYFNFKNNVYTQPKIDGFRCITNMVDSLTGIHTDKSESTSTNKAVLMTSNSGKQFSWFSLLRSEIYRLFKKLDIDQESIRDHILDGLDGELYAPFFYNEDHTSIYSANQRFSLIQGICSVTAKAPHPLEDQICLYVFDLVDLSGTVSQNDRFAMLDRLRIVNDSKNIVFVPTEKIDNESQLFDNHDRYVQEGYEGVILRAGDLLYKEGPSRASKIQKYKSFSDSEYEIIGIEYDPGVGVEQFVWVCKTDDSTFKVKPMGTKEEKIYMVDNHKDYIGKMLTVKYQELGADGIPRFPVAKGVREE